MNAQGVEGGSKALLGSAARHEYDPVKDARANDAVKEAVTHHGAVLEGHTHQGQQREGERGEVHVVGTWRRAGLCVVHRRRMGGKV